MNLTLPLAMAKALDHWRSTAKEAGLYRVEGMTRQQAIREIMALQLGGFFEKDGGGDGLPVYGHSTAHDGCDD